MGKYQVIISDRAKEDLRKIKQSGRMSDIRKIESLVLELSNNPREGQGKPERLKYQEKEIWSRRINHKDRLVYEIKETQIIVNILQAKGHYNDR